MKARKHSHPLIQGLLIASLFGYLGCAAASSLTVDSPLQLAAIGNYDGQPASVTGDFNAAGSSWYLGTLAAQTPGEFSVSYLGQESAHLDKYLFLFGQGGQLIESSSLISTISGDVGIGSIPFKFYDSSIGTGVVNGIDPKMDGSAKNDAASFAFLVQPRSLLGAAQCFSYKGISSCFDYILGFNDAYAGDADYDDFVVGVNFRTANVSAVPIPAAGWLFGTALIGFMFISNRQRV